MKIVGLDPAPSKGTCIFDCEILQKDHNSLKSYLDEIANNKDGILVCWDAPLTGPRKPDDPSYQVGDFTQRKIESFFSRKNCGFKVPKGISVRPYSGCPHWSMTRHFLGLPRVGPWDVSLKSLPFSLIAEGGPPIERGAYVVEVHPAVAIWLWCKYFGKSSVKEWEYKKSNVVLSDIWECLNEVITANGFLDKCEIDTSDFNPKSDDEMDAFVSWLLGKLWVENSGKVILLGSVESGSFLLPNIPELKNAWERFKKI